MEETLGRAIDDYTKDGDMELFTWNTEIHCAPIKNL